MNYKEQLDEFRSFSDLAWRDLVARSDKIKENDKKYFGLVMDENSEVLNYLENSVSYVFNDQQGLEKDLKHLDFEKTELSRLEVIHLQSESKNEILREKINALQLDLEKARDALQKNNAFNEAKKRKLGSSNLEPKQCIELFSKYSGLEIRTLKDHRTQYIFHEGDDDISDKNDTFVILRLVDDVYEITDSEPPLSNLKEFEGKLNSTNNLTGFIQSIRKALKDKQYEEI